MNNFLKTIAETALFTNRCPICGSVIEFDKDLCDECLNAERISAPICLKCGCSKRRCICSHSKRNPEHKAVIAPFYYKNSISKGVLNLKMNSMPRLVGRQGKEIARSVKSLYELIGFDLVTYIPMRKYDERFRGFNQARLLAEVVSSECGVELKELLLKKLKNKMQKRQNASDRFVNMYNVFEVSGDESLNGKTILLVDDVKTTGATLSSAALTLKANGAKDVYCAVFAIVN